MKKTWDYKEAAEILKNGGVGVFPTDTAYGIGCRIDDEKAVGRLFKLRKRSETKAVPVLVSSVDMAKKYWESTPEEVAKELVSKYWPGALTIILRCNKEKVPDLVRGGGDTLGLRMPDNEVLLKIIEEVGVPIVGTSANFAGESTPYKFEDLDQELLELVDFVLRDPPIKRPVLHASQPRLPRPGTGGQVAGVAGRASTVIDCTVSPWRVLRQGKIILDIN